MAGSHPFRAASFTCHRCGEPIPETAPGTKNRNHCPWCLWSLHVAEGQDQHDRDSNCKGLMEPIAISAQKDGEWSIVHRCKNCGVVRTNRIAGDDDATVLLCLALRPLSSPPFPLEEVLANRRSVGTGNNRSDEA